MSLRELRDMDSGYTREEGSDVELLKAQAHIWNHMFSFINSMSLKCALELGIPDTINDHGRPMTLSDLIAALPIHPTKAGHVRGLMQLLSHSGFFRLQKFGHDQQGYVLTNSSRLLLKDNPFSLLPFVTMLDDALLKPSQCMGTWFKNDDPTAFYTAQGMLVWDLTSRDPKLSNAFDEAMASDTRIITSVVIDNYKEVFEGIESLVDVGGGTGTMAKAIAKAFPSLECTVLDRPHVVHGLEETNNLKFLGGDMFDTIPSANAILLKWILHNWGDEDCVKILKKCREAIVSSRTKEAKVIIIDMVMEDPNKDDESIETQHFLNMHMMLLFASKQRSEKEWAQLFTNAGFSGYRINPILGLRSLIQVYP